MNYNLKLILFALRILTLIVASGLMIWGLTKYHYTKKLFHHHYCSQPEQTKLALKISLILFGGGTLFFSSLILWIPNDILNISFSFLSSLATIFAAIVALIVFQDYKKQKQTEILSKIAEEKIKTFHMINKEVISVITYVSSYHENSIYFLSKQIKKILIQKAINF